MNPSVGPLLGAIIDLPGSTRRFKSPPAWLSDVFLIIGLGLGLLLVLAGVIYFWMKARSHRRRHISGGEKVYRGSHDGSGEPAGEDDEAAGDELGSELEDDEEMEHESEHSGHGEHHHHDHDGDHDHEHSSQSRRRYRYRLRRRTHRSRNPTLSETGGLPPVKTQAPTKPF